MTNRPAPSHAALPITGRPSRAGVLAGLALGAGLGICVLALPGLSGRARTPTALQPDREPPRGPGARPDRPPPDGGRGLGLGDRAISPQELRDRLERRLADARQIEARLQDALNALDQGKQPAEVIAALFAPGLPRSDRPFDAGRPAPENRPPLTPQERDELMGVLREKLPRVAAWADELRAQDPDLFEVLQGRLLPRLRELRDSSQRDPAGFDARLAEFGASIGVMRAARDYRRVGEGSPQTPAAREVLRTALSEQFDARLAVTQHDIDMLEQRLAQLRGDVASQRAGRDAFIDAALERITQNAPDRPDDAPPPPPPGN